MTSTSKFCLTGSDLGEGTSGIELGVSSSSAGHDSLHHSCCFPSQRVSDTGIL